MRLRSIWLLMLLVLISSGLVSDAWARRGRSSGGNLRQGLSEINVSCSVDALSAEGESITTATLAGAYGYFVTPAFEVGGNLSYMKIEGFDAFGAVAGFMAYHFTATPRASLVPFIATQVGTGYGYDENPFLVAGVVGTKSFVAPGAAFTSELFYERQMYDTIDINHYGVRVGISLFVG